METITVNRATAKGIKALSRKISKLLEDKESKLYQENVVKFGVPDEVVKKVFSEETLLEAAQSGKAVFYVALKNRCKILGFAQVIEQGSSSTELDRIVVFPEWERKGIGTRLLKRIIADLEKKGMKTISVNAGKEEVHARAFYEKNGFKQLGEEMLEFPWGTKTPIVKYNYQIASMNRSTSCRHPERRKGTGKCSPEQIAECHPKSRKHPCK